MFINALIMVNSSIALSGYAFAISEAGRKIVQQSELSTDSLRCWWDKEVRESRPFDFIVVRARSPPVQQPPQAADNFGRDGLEHFLNWRASRGKKIGSALTKVKKVL